MDRLKINLEKLDKGTHSANDYLDKKFGKGWRKEVPPGIFGLGHSLNELHDYN